MSTFEDSQSEDPLSMFLEEEAHLRETIDRELTESTTEVSMINYVNRIIGLAKGFGIEDIEGITPADARDAEMKFELITTRLEIYKYQARAISRRRGREFSVALDAAMRAKIRHHVGQLKTIVDTLKVSQEKRDALHKRISNFEDEVNRDRTRFDQFAALVIEGSKVADAALKPVRKTIDSISRLLGAAKTKEDAAIGRLPPPEERKLLEGPDQQPDDRADDDDDTF